LERSEGYIELCGDVVPYTVFVRKVKYPRIEVSTGRVQVIIPRNFSGGASFLESHRRWLEKKYEIIKNALRDVPKGKVPILGDMWEIRDSNDFQLDFNNKCILINRENPSHKRKLLRKIRELVRRRAKKFVEEFGKEYDVQPNKIYIRNQKSKWGSCSGNNNLSFNIRTIALPDRLFEYVVFHEFVHLMHKNHNRIFWSIVKEKFKDLKEIKSELAKFWFKSLVLERICRPKTSH